VLAIAFVAWPILGFIACGVVWQPDERARFTGFPMPIGVDVRLADGSMNGGSGPLGYVTQPGRVRGRGPRLRDTSLGGMTPEDFLVDLAGRMRPARSKPHRQLSLFEETQTSPGLS